MAVVQDAGMVAEGKGGVAAHRVEPVGHRVVSGFLGPVEPFGRMDKRLGWAAVVEEGARPGVERLGSRQS